MNPTRLILSSPKGILTLLVAVAFAAGAFTVFAQQKKKPTTWAEKKAQILKPLTAEEKQLIQDAIPAKAKVDYVTPFDPTPFGFKIFKKELRPSSFAWKK